MLLAVNNNIAGAVSRPSKSTNPYNDNKSCYELHREYQSKSAAKRYRNMNGSGNSKQCIVTTMKVYNVPEKRRKKHVKSKRHRNSKKPNNHKRSHRKAHSKVSKDHYKRKLIRDKHRYRPTRHTYRHQKN
jgi:hypothetical protein